MALRLRLRRLMTAFIRYINPTTPSNTNIIPLGKLDVHGVNATILWASTPAKLYNAGVNTACVTSSFHDTDKLGPSVTTTNSRPSSVAPADPVNVKKSLQASSIDHSLRIWRWNASNPLPFSTSPAFAADFLN
jgi:hypothetical protein